MLTTLSSIDVYSWLLLAFMLVTLIFAVFAGKVAWGKKEKHDAAFVDELKIVLGGTLSMFGLLMGFILTFAISGHNTRMAAEENEAIAIGNAFQRTTLLSEVHQEQAETMLQNYLALRVEFFATEDDDKRAAIRMESIQMQTHMWTLISQLAKKDQSPLILTALNATNDLYTAQQKTMSSWRHQIPGIAWALLILFGICSNFLIGYNIRGKAGSNKLVCIMPIITAMALFMIAEIDVPGRGLIQVAPDNLNAINVTLEQGGLAP
jgi:hypothetical protein